MDIMEYTVDKFHIVDQKPVPDKPRLASFFCLSRLTIFFFFFFEKSCLTILKITEITLIDPMT